MIEPEDVFQREVLDRHRLPHETPPGSTAEPSGADIDSAAAAAAVADRAWLVQMTARTRNRS
ncbi:MULTISPECIES: hypothetical protein [unclassified Nonomuraea]|uniref:hypothetical protein n=1 Tax=unclassified Nonomuraea TaxID=2593643 RepID=UPI0033F54F2C